MRGEDWRREKEAAAEWEHFNRKTVTSQVAKGAPRNPQSGIRKGGEGFQSGILNQADFEGSKHRVATGAGREALNLETNLWGRQICLGFHRKEPIWGPENSAGG